ncbi:hypothetical protein KI387_002809, partial [Taxus chinensis]
MPFLVRLRMGKELVFRSGTVRAQESVHNGCRGRRGGRDSRPNRRPLDWTPCRAGHQMGTGLPSLPTDPVSVPNEFQPFGEVYVSALDGSEMQRLTFNAYEDGTVTWHNGNGIDFESLSLASKKIGGEKLK